MSKTQLQTNNAKLESLIAELQGKAAGGGGNVETCSVEINHWGMMNEAFGETIINGQKLPYVYFRDPSDNIYITEASIVKGSYMILVLGETVDMECANCVATYLGTGMAWTEYYAVRIDGDAYIFM